MKNNTEGVANSIPEENPKNNRNLKDRDCNFKERDCNCTN